MMNVVITTKLVMKCIFRNFGAIPKRMVKTAKLNSQKVKLQCRVHKNLFTKIKLNKVFTKKQLKTKIPTLYLFLFLPSCPLLLPSPWLPSMLFDISYKVLKHILNSLRDRLFDRRLQKQCNLRSLMDHLL